MVNSKEKAWTNAISQAYQTDNSKDHTVPIDDIGLNSIYLLANQDEGFNALPLCRISKYKLG